MNAIFRLVSTLVLCLLASFCAAQTDLSHCGPITNAFGPFDYRTANKYTLARVEEPHFPPEVENLIRGKGGSLGGDLDYTLRVFPNHHRALLSMLKLGERSKWKMPAGASYPVECYFERAVRFQPSDTVARSMYAIFSWKTGNKQLAVQQLELAAKTAPDNGFTQFNVGLIYFDFGDFDRALIQAHTALALGLARQELVERLKGRNKWTDLLPAAGGAAQPPASSSAH